MIVRSLLTRHGRAPAVRHSLLALGLTAVIGCGGAGPEVEIRARRTAELPSAQVLPGATALERFQGVDPAQPEPSDDLISYDLPSGWTALAPTSDRMVNLRPAGDPEASCYLSFLQGNAGGLEANVNRWRAQLGAPALNGEQIAALPTAPLLTRDAVLVEAEGTFTGMGTSAPRAGFKLLGLLVSDPTGSLFLKFTGPAPLVEMERERFLDLARSLRLAASHAGPSPGPAAAAPGAAAPSPAASGTLRWRVPEGWNEQGQRPMREVTFALGPGAECYIARLPGDAGGLQANLDRWCTQFGSAPLSAEGYAALPHANVLGQEIPVLELEGHFTGMDGTTQADQGLLGVACIRGHESVFVKLTGPADVVRRERTNFLAFVGSLEEAR